MTSALIANGHLQPTPSPGPGSGRYPYLTPVPECEPPFDDERSAVSRLQQLRVVARTMPIVSSTGALTAARPAAPVATADRVKTRPATIRDTAVPLWSQDHDVGVRRTATAALPTAERSGPVLARALVEVLCGQRPISQLRVHCAPDVFAGLQARQIARGALGHLINVRVCEPADGVAEISVAFRRAGRVRALAFRMQGLDGRWRVTALQTG